MISREKWAEVIKDFFEDSLPPLIERDVDIPVEIPVNRAISIIGPRRSGKTFVMFQLMEKLLKEHKKEQFLYVNFERADLSVLDSGDLMSMLNVFFEIVPDNRNRKVWLFLDEIQNVSGWEKFVRTALDMGIGIFVSGSSSKLLSREIATSLRGRTISHVILPFSFKECLRAENIKAGGLFSTSEKARILNVLRVFLEYGGYPEAVIYKKEREKILLDIKETLIYRDVVERHGIRNVKALKLLINTLINSKEFSLNRFYNYLKSMGIKSSKNALYNYVQYLNDAFFVFSLRKFSYSYRNAEKSIPKIYLIDNGLLKTNGIDDHGRLMENLVFVELFRRNKNVFYYKFPSGEEVDFVVKDGKKIEQLIQVCYSLKDFSTKDRETRSLINASRALDCKKLLVITYDFEGEEKMKGGKIVFIPLWKWLLKAG